ncbi:hypothetical protein J3F83DRAFT_142009 [Trichoderma novae-zelandiae]
MGRVSCKDGFLVRLIQPVLHKGDRERHGDVRPWRGPWPLFSVLYDPVSPTLLEMPTALSNQHKPGVQPGRFVLASTPQHRRRNDRFRDDWSQETGRLLSLQDPPGTGSGEARFSKSAMGLLERGSGFSSRKDSPHVPFPHSESTEGLEGESSASRCDGRQMAD